MAGKKKDGGTTIIKREEVVEGGHHGGAWKVAYADFVTAMMAFFLLMWLLNATTDAQRRGLADYFTPSNLMSHNSSGNGQPFGGHTPYDDGSLASDRGAADVIEGKKQPQIDVDEDETDTEATPRVYRRDGTSVPNQAEQDKGHTGAGSAVAVTAASVAQKAAVTDAATKLAKQASEKANFEAAADQIRKLVAADPDLAPLAKQLAIDLTPDGLRLQIMDEDRLPMFASGSATMSDRARMLVQKITPVLLKLPEDIAISGHTDSAPYNGHDRSNWELSAERANATRRMLVDGGLPPNRIRSVTGNADRDPLLPADPMAAANRRIAIVVLRDSKSR
jgi:chemotaxis protein MotB